MDSQSDPGAVADIEYSSDMGVTHNDFFRLLPSAMGDHQYQVNGNQVRAQVHSGTVKITIGPQQERRIALMRIPYATVHFQFRGVTESQQQAFKAYFDLRFQRGGG